MKSLLCFFTCLILTMASFAQKNESKQQYKLLDNIVVKDSVYSVYAKSESSIFTLKICNVDSCALTQEYVKTTSHEILANSVLLRIKSKLDPSVIPSEIAATDKKALGKQLMDKLQAADLAALKASKNELENTLYAIDNEKDQYSAKLILNDSIPYEIHFGKTSQAKLDKAIETLNARTEEEKKTEIKHDSMLELTSYQEQKTEISNENKRFQNGQPKDILKIIDAKIQFFNNKASSIYIKAILNRDGKEEKLIFLNNQFSVPMRFFNNYSSTVTAETEDNDVIRIEYNDVFDYESAQFFNYSIANQQVTLSNEKDSDYTNSEKVIQRRFFDFFTAIVYSDVMAFNSENPNSLLNAQAKLLMPLNLRNIRKWSFGRQFITTANIALDNSFQDESRFINIKDDESFSNFDLLTKNNLYAKISLDLITHEAKGWFTHISLGYNAAFYRTGLRYTETQPDVTDIVTERQLLSLGHGPYLNFEIRPQTNFGADVSFSIEDLNYSDTAMLGGRSFDNDLIQLTGKDHFVMPFNLINVEANFYWLTNPEKSKGGIYAKIGSYFHTESNSVFPQIMVGYATNLTSFVNRFKPKTETASTTN
ncbi:hypothetical protein SAMN04515667_1765 [Formosa sp. Hel1_31_208]|uniref:hypothetical protein n=1 Tax=Formosa sp. Hel1_31_208 TaxID=1798225 RepID=UPI00087C216F|nr:hypothetical protein [Formosa sp. Hel1_31_208]SDS25762.1 hypothetical protein SAMN04515667_1765 [Formosa sp. Hel1_31_208]